MWSNPGYSEQQSAVVDGQQVAVLAPPPTAGAYLPAQQGPQGTLAPITPTALDGAFDVPATLIERIELCRFLSAANLLPKALQEAPANVLLIMHKALALQIPLSVAIEHLYVIDGKIGHSAELLRALLHRHGHMLRWIEISDKQVIGELILRHDSKNPRREKFTIADASRMELTNKANWKKDPSSMMVARVSTRLVSRHAPEVAVALGNLSAIDVDDDPVVAHPEVPEVNREEQAAGILAAAEAAETVDELRAIGTQAREAGLLDVAVEGCDSLQHAILKRMDQLAKARKAGEKA